MSIFVYYFCNGHLKVIDTIEKTYNVEQPNNTSGGYYNTYLKNKNKYIKLKNTLNKPINNYIIY